MDREGDGVSTDDDNQEDDDVGLIEEDGSGESDGDSECESGGSSDSADEMEDASGGSDEDDEMSEEGDNNYSADDVTYEEESGEDADVEHEESILAETNNSNNKDVDVDNKSKAKKRKFSNFEGQLNAANKSLCALKKLAGATQNASSNTNDGILSNEDFQRIKELKAKKEARTALTQHGFKLPSSDQLSLKRVDAAKLEANIRKKLIKEERLALIREGREERGKYQPRTAVKQKKTGGLSNQQKEHKKAMPLAAKRAKIAKTRQEKKKQHQRSGKQFRGRKAWK